MLVGALAWAGPLVANALLEWDRALLIAVRDRSPLAFRDGIMLESPGNLLVTLPLLLLGIGVALWRGRLLFAIALPLGYALARLLVWEGWWIWARARPTLVADGVASSSEHSFPSGHVLLAVYVYGFPTWPWIETSANRAERVVACLVPLAVASGVGCSRLLLGAHRPSDVVAGFLFGTAYLALVVAVLRYAERIYPSRGRTHRLVLRRCSARAARSRCGSSRAGG